MPITSIGSYGPTTAEFDVNWEEADGELAPGAITLAGNYTRTDFASERTTLLASIGRVPSLAGDARFAASDRDNVRANLITRAPAVSRGGLEQNRRQKLPRQTARFAQFYF